MKHFKQWARFLQIKLGSELKTVISVTANTNLRSGALIFGARERKRAKVGGRAGAFFFLPSFLPSPRSADFPSKKKKSA